MGAGRVRRHSGRRGSGGWRRSCSAACAPRGWLLPASGRSIEGRSGGSWPAGDGCWPVCSQGMGEKRRLMSCRWMGSGGTAIRHSSYHAAKCEETSGGAAARGSEGNEWTTAAVEGRSKPLLLVVAAGRRPEPSSSQGEEDQPIAPLRGRRRVNHHGEEAGPVGAAEQQQREGREISAMLRSFLSRFGRPAGRSVVGGRLCCCCCSAAAAAAADGNPRLQQQRQRRLTGMGRGQHQHEARIRRRRGGAAESSSGGEGWNKLLLKLLMLVDVFPPAPRFASFLFMRWCGSSSHFLSSSLTFSSNVFSPFLPPPPPHCFALIARRSMLKK